MEDLQFLKNINTIDELKLILQEHKLVYKEYKQLDLILIKYNKEKSNMKNNDVLKCRGVVLDKDLNIVCFPPIKSSELTEFISDKTVSNLDVEEFLDGTMINLFYYNGWHISTRSNIGANCRWYSKKHFNDLFTESSDLDFEKLDTDTFYTFVLQHPENRIVTTYTEPKITLVHAGKIINNKLELLNIKTIGDNLKLNIPTIYNFNSLDEIIGFVEKQSFEFQGVVLKYGLVRSKIRNPNYNYVRNIRGNNNNIKYLYFDLKKNLFIPEYLRFFPEYIEQFEDYNKEYNELIDTIFVNYQNYHVRKVIKDIKNIPYNARRFCYELHGVYKETKKHITRNVVLNYINSLPPARVVYALNN